MTRERRAAWCFALLVALSVLAVAPTARAQDEPDPAAAELFRQGRDLIKKGDWKAGCEKLDASMQRYASVSTLLNLALCRQEEGRVATAAAMVQQALVLNRDTAGKQRRDRLQASGEEMLAKLEPRISRLRVMVVPAVEGARASEAGRNLPLDTSVPLDPGNHELLLSAPGRPDTKRQVSLREGETLSIEMSVPSATASSDAPQADPSRATNILKSPPPEVSDDANIPVWVWISGGGGLALSGVAIGFGVDALAAADRLEERCGNDLACDEDPTFDPEPDNDRKNRGLGLAIGFGIGGTAGIVAAIIGLATSREAPSATSKSRPASLGVSVWGSPDGAGAFVSGRF